MQKDYTTKFGRKFILIINDEIKKDFHTEDRLLKIKVKDINNKEVNIKYIIALETMNSSYYQKERRPFNEKDFKDLSIVLIKIYLENNLFDFKNKSELTYKINPTKEIGHNDLGQLIENKNKELKKLQTK